MKKNSNSQLSVRGQEMSSNKKEFKKIKRKVLCKYCLARVCTKTDDEKRSDSVFFHTIGGFFLSPSLVKDAMETQLGFERDLDVYDRKKAMMDKLCDRYAHLFEEEVSQKLRTEFNDISALHEECLLGCCSYGKKEKIESNDFHFMQLVKFDFDVIYFAATIIFDKCDKKMRDLDTDDDSENEESPKSYKNGASESSSNSLSTTQSDTSDRNSIPINTETKNSPRGENVKKEVISYLKAVVSPRVESTSSVYGNSSEISCTRDSSDQSRDALKKTLVLVLEPGTKIELMEGGIMIRGNFTFGATQ